ncbi:MAG: cation diffusion facilitator family transporter [Roseiflexaceae bacterium]
MERGSLTRFAWLSIGAALLTIGLKTGAYLLTGSVGLLSDALESLVNLVAAVAALIALTIAARPPDDEHAYGHDKVEYFSSGFEGALILVAAGGIVLTSVPRLLAPQPIEQAGLGVGVALVASALNFGVARVLLAAARRHHSITLEADSEHLMADVWTSLGVLGGVVLVALTGWHWLDPLIALAVALNIVRSGVQILRRSMLGLLDTVLPASEQAAVQDVLARRQAEGIQWHALRTRQSGARRFVSVHILVPGGWSVQRGHTLLEQIEAEIRAAVPNVNVMTHLEPLDDPVSFADTALDRDSTQQETATDR